MFVTREFMKFVNFQLVLIVVLEHKFPGFNLIRPEVYYLLKLGCSAIFSQSPERTKPSIDTWSPRHETYIINHRCDPISLLFRKCVSFTLFLQTGRSDNDFNTNKIMQDEANLHHVVQTDILQTLTYVYVRWGEDQNYYRGFIWEEGRLDLLESHNCSNKNTVQSVLTQKWYEVDK